MTGNIENFLKIALLHNQKLNSARNSASDEKYNSYVDTRSDNAISYCESPYHEGKSLYYEEESSEFFGKVAKMQLFLDLKVFNPLTFFQNEILKNFNLVCKESSGFKNKGEFLKEYYFDEEMSKKAFRFKREFIKENEDWSTEMTIVDEKILDCVRKFSESYMDRPASKTMLKRAEPEEKINNKNETPNKSFIENINKEKSEKLLPQDSMFSSSKAEQLNDKNDWPHVKRLKNRVFFPGMDRCH